MNLAHPTVNASLNAVTTVLLVCGYRAIRAKQVARHRAFMGAACVTSLAFLISYLVYHARVGSVSFQGQGVIRPAYFLLLMTHSVLAVFIVPMVLRTLYLALRGRIDQHRRIARWTFPIWVYVSITGVLVYLMLYWLPV